MVTLLLVSCQADHTVSTSGGGRRPGRPWKLICLGDGITAGVGLPPDTVAYPARLAQLLEMGEDSVQVVNASLKGENLSAALGRLPWMFQQRFDALLIALGDAELQQQSELAEWSEAWESLLQAIRRIDPEMQVFLLVLSPEKLPITHDEALKELADTYNAYWLGPAAREQATIWQNTSAPQMTLDGHIALANWLVTALQTRIVPHK